MSLSALPKAFDFEMKKGWFPHLFNRLENQSYVGPMPDKECYNPDTMFKKAGDRKAFDDWYNEQVESGYVFDFEKELIEYCKADVEILAQACKRFRALFVSECRVDPFLEATTIASACNLVFRRKYLKPKTIGLIPKGGYRMGDKQSAIAIQWLCWEEQQRNVRIRHAGIRREVRKCGMKVDGYDDEDRIYEFHGCYWHGCPKCYHYKREHPLKEDPTDSLDRRYERTKAKVEKLRSSGYEVIEMWECEFNEMKRQENLKHLEYLPMLNIVPLEPRDSFFGGRTGNCKVYHKCTQEEKDEIHYLDVCSLYPWVCKYGKYPTGHPTVHVGEAECRSRGMAVEGLLKCKVLPPLDLYHPVLPAKMHDKLMFVLCRTCGEKFQQEECDHTSDERALTGTWTMDEVRKAVEKGYIILDMFELWEYKMSTFETGGLFTEFIDAFLKQKQEASGYPSWCFQDPTKVEEAKAKYIEAYQEREKIILDPAKIEKNSGLRSMAKLMLNSFWGKFGQRENLGKTTVIRNPKEYFDLLTSPEVEVLAIVPINQDAMLVNWRYIKEVGEFLRTTNVVIAAYTTSQARLKLYDHLDKLGVQVLYYDTDSVLFIWKNGLYRVPVGDYLGEMTDELEGEYGAGSYIVEFVSGGPKTYAYVVWSTRKQCHVTECKIKGLTLNLKACEQMNFNQLKKMVLTKDVAGIEMEECRIRRTKERDVITVRESKTFRVTGPKRKRKGEYDTLPYGYKKKKARSPHKVAPSSSSSPSSSN